MPNTDDCDQLMSNHEAFLRLLDRMDSLEERLAETEKIILKYNGLREELGNNAEELGYLRNKVISLEKEKSERVGKLTRTDRVIGYLGKLAPYLLALVSLLFALAQGGF